jgi:hypothetical protein
MSRLDTLIDAWDEAHRELAIGLGGVTDEDVWKRAHPRLLSVGELVGHVAHWQAVWIMGGGSDRPDIGELPVQSPLVGDGFRYYTSSVDRTVSLDLNAADLLAELARVHDAAKQYVLARRDEPYPGQWGTWENLVQYQAFHVAYHTGQIYSVRHLLGHETEDN